MTKMSLVIPARNEEATLPMVLSDVYEVIPHLPDFEVEVICVDDHSRDATANIARSFGATVIANAGKPGKGMALRAGFQTASGDIIMMMDADYSHRAQEIPLLLQALNAGVGLVVGSRVFGGSEEYTHVRALGNVFLSASLGLCTGRYLSDALNGLKLFRRDIFTDFKYTSRAFEIEIELIANALRKGYRIVEVSSHERQRAGGEMKSKVVRHGTRFLLRILWEGFKGVKPIQRPATATSVTESAAPISLSGADAPPQDPLGPRSVSR
jgi:glycosyltransferase involved in cell wall biosynthesis